MIEHLSYSAISGYLSCGRWWQFKYVEKAPSATTPALVFGKAFHESIEHSVLTGGAAVEQWPAAWSKALEGQPVVWGVDTPEQHFNEGLRMLGDKDIAAHIGGLRALVDETGPMVERRVELRVPGVPVPVIGYIDCVQSDGVPCDFKTSARSWGADKAQAEIQTLFYLAALNQAGRTVPGWRFRHHVFVKTKTPKVEVHEHAHKPSEVFWLFRLIQNVWRGIEHEVFPENPTGWRCSPAFCDYWSMCRGRHVVAEA